jgi:hypothetical protein
VALECPLEGSGLSGTEHSSTRTTETANNLNTSPQMMCILFFFRRYTIWNISKWRFTTKRNSEATGRYRMWTSPISSFIALRLVQTGQGPSNVNTAGPCCILEYGEPRECITKHPEYYSSQETFLCTRQVCYTFTRHMHALVNAYLLYSHKFTNNDVHLCTGTVVSNCKASGLRMEGDRSNPKCHRTFW